MQAIGYLSDAGFGKCRPLRDSFSAPAFPALTCRANDIPPLCGWDSALQRISLNVGHIFPRLDVLQYSLSDKCIICRFAAGTLLFSWESLSLCEQSSLLKYRTLHAAINGRSSTVFCDEPIGGTCRPLRDSDIHSSFPGTYVPG